MESEGAFIFYDQRDYVSARGIFEESLKVAANSDARRDCLFNIASCLASEGNHERALESLSEMSAATKTGTQGNDLLYNQALCHYKLTNYNEALRCLDQLLENCRKFYPELLVKDDEDDGFNLLPTQPVDIEDPESFRKLQDSCLIEGLNLRAATLFKLKRDWIEARQCLDRVPIEAQEQVDCVTLHNQAVFEDNDVYIDASVDKLAHLLKFGNKTDPQQGGRSNEDKPSPAAAAASLQVPEETTVNLLILYLQSGQLEAAMELVRTNRSQLETERGSREELLHFIDIQLDRASNKDEQLTYRKLDKLLDRLLERLGGGGQQPSTTANNDDDAKRGKLLEFTLAVVTYQGSILWDNNQYQALERLLTKVGHLFEGSSNVWKTNMANALFMQDTRFEECCQLYEELLPDNSDSASLIEVDPMILSNLCVSYVLAGRNGDAEALIKDVETDEAKFIEENELARALDSATTRGTISAAVANSRQQQEHSAVDSVTGVSTGNYLSATTRTPTRTTTTTSIVQRPPPPQLSIINLVIGTLYCVKYNYEFGLVRMFKSLEPLEQKLHPNSWFHVKRCILALVDNHCKQMLCVKDELFDQTIAFLIQCERHGLLVETRHGKHHGGLNETTAPSPNQFNGKNSVTYEARYLRSILLSVIHD